MSLIEKIKKMDLRINTYMNSKKIKDRKLLSNAIRALCIDMIEMAKSGHPGASLGLADIAEVLWNDFLIHNPDNPNWWNRDRFILSNGHASALLYALLHLSGYNISVEDLKKFRQLHSITPGHPEFGITPGVETTTGPLGQGFANAVGIALAEKILSQQFNRPDFPIIDHYTYVFVGDGCLMEGISHEVASLAGKWQLGKLIVFYDNNSISIDGNVSGWYIDDTKKRFESYHWHVIDNIDGHNPKKIKQSILKAKKEIHKPSLLICNTIIGYGSPNKAGKEVVHGAPLGEEEAKLTKQNLNLNFPPFEIPKEIYKKFDARKKGKKWEEKWNHLYSNYKNKYPELAQELERRMNHQLPKILNSIFKEEKLKTVKKEATRKTSQNVINIIKPYLPELIGGSADLTHSNLTMWNKAKDIVQNNFDGDYIFYGVREFGMFAIMNGLFLHGGFRPFGGTFLVFSDYGRNAIRMSSLMELGVIYVFTHDSIGLGEDGPTHQPIEHLSSLRLIPNIEVWRPCNYHEVLIAWESGLKNKNKPTIIVLSRQNMEMLYKENSEDISKGAYCIYESTNNKEIIYLLSSGSEIELCKNIALELEKEKFSVKIISVPCMERFRNQPKEYKEALLGNNKKLRFAIEASHPQSWYEWVEPENVYGIKEFGLSAPGNDVFKHFGFTVENLTKFILNHIHR